jgi:hypothetical protein
VKLKTTLFSFFAVCIFSLAKANEIEVNNNNCRYSIVIPKGWKEIPIDTIAKKYKELTLDIGLHNSDEDNYFEKSHLQYIFLRSQKSLNQFPFIKIAQEALRSIEYTIANPKIGDNTLSVTTYKIDYEKQLFFLKGKITNKTKEKQFLQVMYPTKNGYIKAMLYSPVDNDIPLSYTEIAETINVSDEYRYFEPSQKFTLSIKHVLLAFLLSGLVFLIIQFSPKLKSFYTKK